MIKDNLSQREKYYAVNPHFKEAFYWLDKNHGAEAGKYVIGDNSFAIVVKGKRTEKRRPDKWEAHRKYIDVQVIISGGQRLGITDKNRLTPIGNYDAENDVEFFAENGICDEIYLAAGDFAALFPSDAHQPALDCENDYDDRVILKVKA